MWIIYTEFLQLPDWEVDFRLQHFLKDDIRMPKNTYTVLKIFKPKLRHGFYVLEEKTVSYTWIVFKY